MKILETGDPEILWVKLDKSFFHLEEDLFVGFVYVPPNDSSYLRKMGLDLSTFFQKIEQDVAKYNGLGKILLMGDFNAYTSTIEDFINHDLIEDSYIPCPISYNIDLPMDRENCDIRAPNESGKLLLQLCKSASLRIINGRAVGDPLGCFTRYPLHEKRDIEPSVIDYSIVSEPFFSMIERFTVSKLTSLSLLYSDHCFISTRLKTSCFIPLDKHKEPCQVSLSPSPHKFLWNSQSEQTFIAELNSSATTDKLKSFDSLPFASNQEGVNNAVNQLSNIILDVANSSITKKKFSPRQRNKRSSNHKKWFNKECSTTKNKLSRLASQMKQNPFNRDLQAKYRALYLQYKTLIRKKSRAYHNRIKENLLSVESNNPRMFWEIISKMKSDDNVKHNGEQLDDLPQKAEKYINYFKNLYSAKGAAEDQIGSVFKTYLRSDQRSENIMKHLNSPIKCEEVVNGIKKLKLGKAAGIDLIMNEFLKAGSNVLAKPITKLFNHILLSHSYPEQWSVNILSTIHKGGSKDNLDNYRGISVSSCFAKLYGAVLSSRLEKTISEFDLIGSNQIGFLKGHRTSDHIFVVNLLINKVVKKLGKALYTAFIDLRKAYDTINRNYLFSKLWSFGFEGEVLYSLQSMYKCVYQRIKLQNNLLEPVASELGLRQGCNLSPLLFNLFIEDIKFEFDAKCDQVCLADKQLSHLLYADDLLLISTSQSGLQRCLDKIQAYFSRFKLSVNLKKSNIMVFNKTGKIPKHLLFRIGKDQVDFATRYKYLGTLLSSSGSYKPAIENLNEKSRKAYFSLLTILKNIDFDQGVCLKIFDTAIKPILTYNSEFWTQLSSQQIKIFRKIENVTG